MQIKNRIKVLRKDYLNLTQNDFSKKINISRSNLANIESGLINITDRIITDICTTFSVNEQWLRNGKEDVFAKNKETILSKVANLLDLDDTEQKFLHAYLSLSSTQRTNFKESLRQIILAYDRQNKICEQSKKKFEGAIYAAEPEREAYIVEQKNYCSKENKTPAKQ